MTRWSRQQDEYLMEHCNEGVERIADAMRRRFGVARTPEAVRRHAYRIGAPLVEYEVCGGCGRKVLKLTPEGVCYQCNQHALAEGHRRRCDELRDEIRRNESREERRRAERECDRERARASRLRRKLASVG